MRLLLSSFALAVNGLAALLMLALIAFGHMIMPGVIVALAIIALSVLNAAAILFGARFATRKTDPNATANTFD